MPLKQPAALHSDGELRCDVDPSCSKTHNKMHTGDPRGGHWDALLTGSMSSVSTVRKSPFRQSFSASHPGPPWPPYVISRTTVNYSVGRKNQPALCIGRNVGFGGRHLSPVPAVLRLLCDKNLSKFLKPSSLHPHLWNKCHDSHLTISESAVQWHKTEYVKSLAQSYRLQFSARTFSPWQTEVRNNNIIKCDELD